MKYKTARFIFMMIPITCILLVNIFFDFLDGWAFAAGYFFTWATLEIFRPESQHERL